MASSLTADLEQQLGESLGRRPDVIAEGTGEDVILVATRDSLARHADGQWSVWGWETVATGSWHAETRRFRWRLTDGTKHEASLDEVGRLPECFRERVQASTLMTESHDLERGRIEIIGRRSLDGRDATSWYATAGGGASLADPATAALVVERTDHLRAEYDLS